VKARPLLSYFVMVFAITWGIAALSLFGHGLLPKAITHGPAMANPLFYLAVYAPAFSSLLLTAIFDGVAGLRKLAARFIPWRVGFQWYLLILVGYPVALLIAGRIAGLFGASQGHLPNWGQFYYALIPALAADPGPLGEELGWRGFALPRMLERWKPLPATLILGLIWGVWHLPAFFIAGLPQSHLLFLALLLGTISISVIDTWIFLRTNGNLLPMILVHLVINHCGKLLGIPIATTGAVGAVCVLAIVFAGGLRVPQPAQGEPAAD
jgi:membrane protease YdiL (CAAX protease family)